MKELTEIKARAEKLRELNKLFQTKITDTDEGKKTMAEYGAISVWLNRNLLTIADDVSRLVKSVETFTTLIKAHQKAVIIPCVCLACNALARAAEILKGESNELV